MILNFSEVLELKKAVAERFSVQLHFCDSCGGQFFTFEDANDALKDYITAYFLERGLKVRFSEDGNRFSVI